VANLALFALGEEVQAKQLLLENSGEPLRNHFALDVSHVFVAIKDNSLFLAGRFQHVNFSPLSSNSLLL
jgi:hypothetical protein